MSTGLKIFIWATVALVIGGIVVTGFRVKKIWDNISYGNYTFKADLSGLSLTDLPDIILKGSTKSVPIRFGLTINNNSSTSLSFCFFKITFYYQGFELATTSDKLAQGCQELPKNDSLVVTDDINVTLSRGMAKLLSDKYIFGKQPEIDYSLDLVVKLFGIPIAVGWVLKILKVKKTFVWN